MQTDTKFVKNELETHAQVNVWIYCNQQNKHSLTKGKMERPTPMKTEQAWNDLYLLLLPLLLLVFMII
jgi:hypothetical protein